MADIFKVLPAHVMTVWPQVSRMLQPAVDRAGTHTIEDVRKKVITGYSDLWVQCAGDKVSAAMVTEFAHFPKGIWLNMWLAGAAKETPFEDALWEPHIIEFARFNGCTGIHWIGRKGWRERNKHLKINSEQIVYSLLLRDLERVAA